MEGPQEMQKHLVQRHGSLLAYGLGELQQLFSTAVAKNCFFHDQSRNFNTCYQTQRCFFVCFFCLCSSRIVAFFFPWLEHQFQHGPLKELNLFFQSDTNIYSLVLVVCAGPTTITARTAAVFFPREEQQLVLHFVEPNQYSVLDFPKPEQEMWLTRPGKRTNWTEAVTAVQDRNAAEL